MYVSVPLYEYSAVLLSWWEDFRAALRGKTSDSVPGGIFVIDHQAGGMVRLREAGE